MSPRALLWLSLAPLGACHGSTVAAEDAGATPVAPSAIAISHARATSGGETATVAVIVIDASGAITLDGVPSPMAELTARVAAARAKAPSLKVVIEADGHVPYASVIDVMDKVRAAGVDDIGLGTAALPKVETKK